MGFKPINNKNKAELNKYVFICHPILFRKYLKLLHKLDDASALKFIHHIIMLPRKSSCYHFSWIKLK